MNEFEDLGKEKKMNVFKDVSLGLMFLSISVFFIVISFGANSLVKTTEKVSLQQEKIFESANQSAEIVTELGFISAAFILETQGMLGKTAADNIVYTGIENIGNKSERLEEILTAVNDSR